jgi:uncharacterized protein
MQTHNDDLFVVADDGAIDLHVHAQPGAGRTAITGRHGRALKIRVAVPPEGGRANEELAKVVAEAFRIDPKAVALVAGDKSRTKRFRITGVEEDAFAHRLDELVAEGGTGRGPSRPNRPR